MTEEKVRRREWVKNAAIVFLSILLVLTFFSNTIMNRTLSEAATKQVTNGSIVAQVRVSGKVTAEGEYTVKAEKKREIRTVFVKVGDTVNVGDSLFVLGQGDSEEIEAAQEALRNLEISYQRAAIGVQNYDYTVQDKELNAAAEQLAAARANYNQATIYMCDNMGIKSYRDEAGNIRYDAAGCVIFEFPEDFYSGDTEDARKKLESAQKALDDLESSRAEYILAAEKEMNDAYAELIRLQPLPIDGEEQPPTGTPEEIAAAQAAYDAAKQKYTNLVNDSDPAISAAKDNLSEAQARYDLLLNRDKNNTFYQSWKAAKDKLDAADMSYTTKRSSYDQTLGNNNRAAALSYLELSNLQGQIERQKEKLAELTGGEDNIITANVGGTVTSVSITAGNTANKGDALCTIEVPDLGYQMQGTVTTEQARRLHVGDTATVSNYYWGKEIIATLKSITNDPKNPQQSKIVTFSIDGDVSSGQELKLSVGSRSANYDTIVPNSAIRNDTNGNFVLVIQEKSSPLGNRYIAVRQPVEILASDDENTAVTGGVESGDFVITTTSKPVKAGDQVRMAE